MPGGRRHGDGAVADRRRRRGLPAHARPAVRRRQGPRRTRRRWHDARRRDGRVPALDGAARRPTPRGYWPAQAVANHALARRAVVDNATAITALPAVRRRRVGRGGGDRLRRPGDRMPRIATTGDGRRPGARHRRRAGGGAVDALGEQMVAGADAEGDVLVLCGTTLIDVGHHRRDREVPGLWTIPHTAAGKRLIGGPSNAGGLFLDWVDRLVGAGNPRPPRRSGRRPGVVAVHSRRAHAATTIPVGAAALDGSTSPTGGSGAARRLRGVRFRCPPTHRAQWRAGIAHRGDRWRHARRAVDAGPRRRHRAAGRVSAVPEGAALGAAFLGRLAAGLEISITDAARWASTERVVEPDPAWTGPMQDRYARFLELGDATNPEPR